MARAINGRTGVILSATMGAVLCCSSAASAGDIIFADVVNLTDPDGNSIRRMTAEGANLETLIPTGGGLRGFDVDPVGGFIYWTDVDNFVIRRARLDGTDQVDLVGPGLTFPAALRLDLPASRLYWGDQTDGQIFSTDLTLVSPVTFIDTPFNRGLAIDSAAGRVYWTTSDSETSGKILSRSLGGTEMPAIVRAEGASKPGSLAVDSAAGKIYWTDPIALMVRRANLDGTNVEPLFMDTQAPAGRPRAITLDLFAGHVYFSLDREIEESPSQGEIYRINLDGTESQLIAANLGLVNDLYILQDEVECAADFDGNGVREVADIFAFLVAWFAGLPSANFDAIPEIGVPDIFAFLALWFAGCP